MIDLRCLDLHIRITWLSHSKNCLGTLRPARPPIHSKALVVPGPRSQCHRAARVHHVTAARCSPNEVPHPLTESITH